MNSFLRTSFSRILISRKQSLSSALSLRQSSKQTASAVPYGTSIHKKENKDALTGMLPTEADAVVIGAGTVGCSTAYHLAKLNGGNIVLLEKNRVTSGTTWHTAGILWGLRWSEAELRMVSQTQELISEILPQETGEEAGWINTGLLYVAKTSEQLNDIRLLTTFGRALGIEATEVSANEVRDIHPLVNTADIYAAVHSLRGGSMDPATYCMAYVKAALKHNAKVFENCPVTNIITEDNEFGNRRVSAVETPLGRIITQKVVNCTGSWAPYIGEMVGVNVPQLSYEHSYVVTEPIPGILNTPIVKDHGTVYMKPQGNALQFGGFEKNPPPLKHLPRDFAFGLYDFDWDVFEPHMNAGINRIPAIADSGIRSTVCGPESFTTDGKPNMGESPEVRGFFLGSAFNSAGMMMGGGAGRQLAHWVYHGRPEIDMHNCDIRRYPTTVVNRNRWLKEKCHEKFAKRYDLVYQHDQPLSGRNQRKTVLYDVHQNAGALMGYRASFERPAYYVIEEGKPNPNLKVLEYDYYGYYGHKKNVPDLYCEEVLKDCTYEFPKKSHKLIGQECLTCRTSAAVFDSSYMAKLYLAGRDADAAARRILSRDVSRSRAGQFVYSLMLNSAAGCECDIVATKVKGRNGDTEYYLTAPSSAEQHCISHMQTIIQDEKLKCSVDNRSQDQSILSVQGRKSAEWLQPLVDDVPLTKFRYGEWENVKMAGKEIMIARLSFVGELGFEIHCTTADVLEIYNQLMDGADKYGARLAGYRAMDSLSTETGFHHWPHSISMADNPLEAGLERFCDKHRDYIGGEELSRLEREPLKKRLVYITSNCSVPLFGNEALWRNDEIVGHTRTADYAYALGCNVGCGYITLPSLTDADILNGNYHVERLGVKYPANVHIRAPFDPQFRRIKGNYDEEEQLNLLEKLKHL